MVSPCPSVRPSVCPSVDRIVSALYFHNTRRVHFISTHLIKQLQKVFRMSILFLNSKIQSFGKFFKFIALTLSCFDLRSTFFFTKTLMLCILMGAFQIPQTWQKCVNSNANRKNACQFRNIFMFCDFGNLQKYCVHWNFIWVCSGDDDRKQCIGQWLGPN